jgi:LemA protein
MKPLVKYSLIGISVVALLGGIIVIDTQRTLAPEHQKVDLAWSEIQNVLNRQAELIPNLAETAMGYAKHEHDTFADYAKYRSIGHVDGSATASADVQKRMEQSAALASQALVSLRNVREATPALQANDNFKRLMVELEGSINRVTVARHRAQQAIFNYNGLVVRFPTNLIAGVIGLGPIPYYQASESDQHAPKLNLRG